MKVYSATRTASSALVHDDGKQRDLNPRLDLRNHSPTGFAWGYGGSGPSQLALALLADALGDDARAVRLYQQFKMANVTRWPQDEGWTVTERQICEWADKIEHDMASAASSELVGIPPEHLEDQS